MTSVNLSTCIGRYCGHPPEPNLPDAWQTDKCGACPWGYKSNSTKFCVKCEDVPDLYDWLFLGFMALLPCMLHWVYILKNKNQTKLLVAQFLLSFVECVTAAVLAIISTDPKGKMDVVTCGVKRLSDWYTMFYNPQIKYKDTIHCTQEAVYPLVTIVCIYYAYTLVLMMLLRLSVLPFIGPSKQWRDPVYAALYFHPVLVVIQVFIGGLLYYAFPYITVFVSLIALATYFIWNGVTSLKLLFYPDLIKNFLVILWHFALLAFGIVAISNSTYYLVSLVPVPLIFYLATVKFTDPDSIAREMRSD